MSQHSKTAKMVLGEIIACESFFCSNLHVGP